MDQCENHRDGIQLYLDGEISDHAREGLYRHIYECSDCRRQLESEMQLRELLRRAQPLYSPGEALRARVEALLAENTTEHREGRRTLRRRLGELFAGRAASSLGGPLAAALMAVGVAVIALISVLIAPPSLRAAQYLNVAVATHRKFIGGKLPLELISDSPAGVVAWFAGKVPFQFRLPHSAGQVQGEPAYRLSGARVVDFRGTPAALVVYQSQAEQISLLVASSKSAAAADGEEVVNGDIRFHYISKGGFNVVTWSNHGLTYALVSSPHGSARHSCVVCHQDLADNGTFR